MNVLQKIFQAKVNPLTVNFARDVGDTPNNKIIAMVNKLSLSNLFRYKPELTHTSSDGQKYQVTVDSLLANHSFKYFGKDKGVSMYTFLDDRHSLFYSAVRLI